MQPGAPRVDSGSQLPPEGHPIRAIPNRGRRCSVCDHPNAAEINRHIVRDSASLRELATQFTIGSGPLKRHRRKCIPAIIERERAALIAAHAPELLPIVLAARDARLRRLQRIADKQDELIAAQGLTLTRTTEAGVDEVYNQRIVADAIAIHDAIRAELGETSSASAAGAGGPRNQTVVFMPGSLGSMAEMPTPGATRGLLAEAAAAARAAVAGPQEAQPRVSMEGRRTGQQTRHDLPPPDASQTDVILLDPEDDAGLPDT